MIEFIQGGYHHWTLGGHSPCGRVPYPAGYTEAELCRLLGIKPQKFAFPEPCPNCMNTKQLYLKYLRNGGIARGYEIIPFEDRP